jgi:hypothetical protein
MKLKKIEKFMLRKIMFGKNYAIMQTVPNFFFKEIDPKTLKWLFLLK